MVLFTKDFSLGTVTPRCYYRLLWLIGLCLFFFFSYWNCGPNNSKTEWKHSRKAVSSKQSILNIWYSLLKCILMQVFRDNRVKNHLTEENCRIIFRIWFCKKCKQMPETNQPFSFSPFSLGMLPLTFKLSTRVPWPVCTNIKSPICYLFRWCSAHIPSLHKH